MKSILLILIMIVSSAFGQDTQKSEAYKKNPYLNSRKVFKPKYNAYPLIAGYILMKDANAGDPFAQHELALRYLTGKGFLPDTVAATSWMKKAVDHNLSTAQFNYGILNLNGIGVNWNPFEAFKLFESAAKSGMPEAAYIYGLFYTENFVVNRNLPVAYDWVKIAADKGMKEATKVLEQMKKQGVLGTDAKHDTYFPEHYNTDSNLLQGNYDLDFIQFEEDSVQEPMKAPLEAIYSKEVKELKKDLFVKDSVEFSGNDTQSNLIEIAQKNGSPEALLILARSQEAGFRSAKDTIKSTMNYLRAIGMGIRKNIPKLIELSSSEDFFKSLQYEIDNGNPDAMYVWATLRTIGFNNMITEKQSEEMLNSASALNHIPSLIQLGILKLNTSKDEKDSLNAISFFTKAETLGSIEAKVRKNFFFLRNGYNYEQNKKMVSELSKAERKGSILAQTVLAFLYQNGIGVKTNKAKAANLYRTAASRGNEAAFAELKRMYDNLRPDDERFQIYDN